VRSSRQREHWVMVGGVMDVNIFALSECPIPRQTRAAGSGGRWSSVAAQPFSSSPGAFYERRTASSPRLPRPAFGEEIREKGNKIIPIDPTLFGEQAVFLLSRRRGDVAACPGDVRFTLESGHHIDWMPGSVPRRIYLTFRVESVASPPAYLYCYRLPRNGADRRDRLRRNRLHI
jgi:hypothetical protein